VVITVLAYGLLAPLRRCRQPGAFGWKIAAIGEYSISLTRFLRCLAMAGFYSYTPEKFFQRLVREFGAFCSSPSEEGIMSVVLPLCHLREWLSPGFAKEVGKAIEAKPDLDRTNEERLYITLTKMREYELVLALCNHAKHFEYNKEPLDDKMCQLHGASAGMMRSGDSLGITHYTVDGIEIRDIFWPVYRMYFDYFETRSPSLAASACPASAPS
jgi:hypothetical protein